MAAFPPYHLGPPSTAGFLCMAKRFGKSHHRSPFSAWGHARQRCEEAGGRKSTGGRRDSVAKANS
jgi:hypothetical protein